MTTIEVKFTEFTNESNWVAGTVGAFTFEAKLFDEGSKFGINKGRVSKLCLRDPNTRIVIVEYDRGWSLKPTKFTKPIFDAVMLVLENSPKRFN